MSLTNKYLALYRQYRPKTFEDVHGQQHIIDTLKNILKENKITHAYLFCGPHGNGKTSTAKIFANAINCIHRTGASPCANCIETIDQNMDIIEIDAASNTGIDDIRELREKIKHLPTQGKYKIYIIDEVHMLSKGAFNALLKTLEEPPKHAIFILATTDPQKIPLTILSRVQRFNFKKIDKPTLIKQIVDIFAKENIKAEEESIKLLVNLGNGSFRDTLSIADQIAIYCANKTITKKDIEELYGIVDFDNIWYLIKCISANQHKMMLDKFNYLIDNGASVEKIVLQIFETLKDYFVFSKTNQESLLEYAPKEKLIELKIDDELLFKYIDIIQKTIKDSQFSDIPKEIVELNLLKMASCKNESLTLINKKNKQLEVQTKNHFNEPKENELISETYEDTNDFQLVNDYDNNKNEDNSESHKNFNSIFNLKNISNTFKTSEDIKIDEVKKELEENGISEINVDNILEKTSEILIAETTKEYENDDLLNDIITTEFDNENFSKTVDIIKPELDQNNVNILAFIFQYIKLNLYDYGTKNKQDLDTMYYNMIEQKIKKEYEYLVSLIKGFKIFFAIEDLIVLRSDDIFKVHELNLKRCNEDFMEAINSIFGRYTNVVAVTKEQVEIAIQNCKQNWSKLKNEEVKMFSLPKLDKYKNKVNANVEFAKKLFGDIVKEQKK